MAASRSDSLDGDQTSESVGAHAIGALRGLHGSVNQVRGNSMESIGNARTTTIWAAC